MSAVTNQKIKTVPEPVSPQNGSWSGPLSGTPRLRSSLELAADVNDMLLVWWNSGSGMRPGICGCFSFLLWFVGRVLVGLSALMNGYILSGVLTVLRKYVVVWCCGRFRTDMGRCAYSFRFERAYAAKHIG